MRISFFLQTPDLSSREVDEAGTLDISCLSGCKVDLFADLCQKIAWFHLQRMSLGSDDVTMGHLSFLRDPMKAEGGHKEDKKVKNGNSITDIQNSIQTTWSRPLRICWYWNGISSLKGVGGVSPHDFGPAASASILANGSILEYPYWHRELLVKSRWGVS